MKKVLAALDASFAVTPVLAAALSLGDLLEAQVEAIHVTTDAGPTVERSAEAAGVPLRVVAGEVVERLVEAGEADDVAALVVGARGVPTDPRPLGTTARAVATSVRKPVLIVPPDVAPPPTLRRILVPLEGTVSSSLAPASLIELALNAQIEVVALHVLGSGDIPAFTDQPQHEHDAWAAEFLARYCPSGIERAARAADRPRGGSRAARAEESRSDLIALGWARSWRPVARLSSGLRSNVPAAPCCSCRWSASRRYCRAGRAGEGHRSADASPSDQQDRRAADPSGPQPVLGPRSTTPPRARPTTTASADASGSRAGVSSRPATRRSCRALAQRSDPRARSPGRESPQDAKRNRWAR